jgi:putative ABC transport system permease protein
MKFLVLILRNMRRQARRAILTCLTIAAATLVFAMLVSVRASMGRIIDRVSKGQRLFVSNRAGPWNLPAKYCSEIKKIPHVTGCAADWDVFMLYRNDSDWIGMAAADPEIVDISPDMKLPPENIASFKHEKRSAAVGYEAMKRYGWQIGQQVMLRGDFNGQLVKMPFIIGGVIPDQVYPNAFVMRRDYLTDTLKGAGVTGLDGIATRLIVRVDSAENLGPVARVIDETYRNSDSETRTQTESEFLASGLANIGNIRAIILSLVIVVLLTVLLIAGNSMAMTVRDRIPEVALLRTLGFGRWRIAYLLFGEATLLGLFGGAVGAAGALALFIQGTDLGSLTNGLALISVSPAVALLSFATAIVVSMLSGTISVTGAIKIAPAIALRRVV